MKAVIVDDETKGIEVLRMMLESHCPNVKIIGHAEEVDDAVQLINQLQPEIVFLDIEMSGQSGFDVFDRVKYHNFHVIFVTAHSQYAVKAFRYSVADYLLKPVDVQELKEAVEKIQLLVKKEAMAPGKTFPVDDLDKLSLRITIQNKVIVIKMNEIIRLEADGAYTRIYITGNKEYVSSYNLRIFEQNLDSNLLIRVPRSHIITILKVEKLAGEKQMHLLMNDGSLIEISRLMKLDFIMQAQNKGLAL